MSDFRAPVHLLQWYLVAYCEQRDEVRTFKESRIRHAQLLNDSFTVPENLALEAYWTARANAFTTEVAECEQHLWR